MLRGRDENMRNHSIKAISYDAIQFHKSDFVIIALKLETCVYL